MTTHRILPLVLALVFLISVPATHAASDTLPVTSTNDVDDGTCNAAHCSLREAIKASNATTGVRETITFQIPVGPNAGNCSVADGSCVIAPTSELPHVTDPVTIDGYTEPGATPNTLNVGDNAQIRIILKGNNAGPTTYGLYVVSSNTTIEGLNIRDFGYDGIFLLSSNNIVQGNFIGTNNDGLAIASNGYTGVDVEGGHNLVGGATPAARNIISGNGDSGIYIVNENGNRVLGNYIGTDATGLAALPNKYGVFIIASNRNVIGGKGSLRRNIISGNASTAVTVRNRAVKNKLKNNFIGVGVDGTTNVTNLGYGIQVYSVGADMPKKLGITRNTIAHNGNRGVVIGADNADLSKGINLSKNSIFENADLGIDLGNDGITANDATDVDSGPNGLQNYPELKSAVSKGGKTRIKGSLNSHKNKSYKIEFFVSAACNASGYGEGSKYLGSKVLTTDNLGNAKFKFRLNKALDPGVLTVSAAATALKAGKPNGTSEFAKCVTGVTK